MRRLCVVLAGLALCAPAPAHASDHLWLDVHASLPGGWDLRLSGNADAGSGSLNAALHARRRGADEYHGYGPVQVGLGFDGTSGRLRVQGPLEADLALQTTGLPTPDLTLVCPGTPMQTVAVALRGTLRLRTGLRPLGALRVSSLAGWIKYNDGPPGPCSVPSSVPPPICRDGRTLGTAVESSPFVDVSWDSRPLYRYARLSYTRGLWSHTLEVPLTRNPFSGRIGELLARLPRRGPLRGSLAFHMLRRATPGADSTCGTTQAIARGRISGRVVAAFRAWGTRTAVFVNAPGSVVDERA
jgi:hypothetical protein